MLESFLVAGNQKPGHPGHPDLRPVVTDACMDIQMTSDALDTLATAVQARRTH